MLNWNSADDSMRCIESLLSQSDNIPDIILVDNYSSDDSVEILQSYQNKHSNSIHFIKNSVNSGYSGGNNIGFQYALDSGYKYIGTLNPDAVADDNWTTPLISQLESNLSIGIATGILARSDRKNLDSTGDFYTTWGIPAPRGRNQSINTAPSEPEYVFGSTGGGFIARSESLREVGLFDEKFFMYFEDVDLSFRMQLAGYKVIYTPKSIAYHKISASTNKVPGLAVVQTFKNLPMLFTKNVPYGLWWKIYPRFILAYSLILGNAIVNGRGSPAIKGWLASWLLLVHMFKKRRQIQSRRKVSTDYISSIIWHDIPPDQTGLRKFRKIFTGKP